MESVQTKISRVRKPRVHIVYEVETEGATVERELPFVVGVLADLSGNAGQEKKSFRERKFIQIDRDNFDEVMAAVGPALTFKVENTLADDGSEISVDLKFNSMADFEPGSIVNQVEPLKNLLEIRNQIRDLMTKADRSEDLEEILENILQNNNQLKQIATDLGLQADTTITSSNQETA